MLLKFVSLNNKYFNIIITFKTLVSSNNNKYFQTTKNRYLKKVLEKA